MKIEYSMKVHNYLILLGLALSSLGCLAQSEPYDFNGDGKKETFALVAPQINEETSDCNGSCECHIRFSDNKIPDLVVENCIGGEPDILGDLDGNGTVEIGLHPWWWTSCWGGYYVFTLKNGKWVNFVDPFSIYHCDENLDREKPLIRKIPDKKGVYTIIYYEFDMESEEIQQKTKVVKQNI